MSQQSPDFIERAEEVLSLLLAHYGEYCQIRHHYALGDHNIRALAEYHITELKTLLGTGFKLDSTEANEYIFFLLEEVFTEDSFQRIKAVCEEAERQLLCLHEQHAYTFFSVVTLTDRVEPEALAKLRYFKARSSYRYGWGMARAAALELSKPAAYCNGDGKDLGKLLMKRLSDSK